MVQVAKEAGFKYMILTAKHHDGFCLWPSEYTEHSVKNSPWRRGKGGVVRELADACQEAGMKMGIYLSPWDRHESTYGNSPVYNQFFKNQLTELLTNYSEIAEAWFDGACGEGPNGRRQEYDWQGYYEVIRKQSVKGKVWYPAECDVSIRPGWFWHKSQDDKVKSLEHLLDIYYKSVGRNSVLLLNVPPNDRGLFSEPDVKRLREFRKVLDKTFAINFAEGKSAIASDVRPDSKASNAVDGNKDTYWATDEGTAVASLEVNLGEPVTFNVSMVQEYIALGQRVEEYRIEAWDGQAWKQIAEGTTIGHKKLDRLPDVTATRVRLTIVKSQVFPLIRTFGLYRAPMMTSQEAL
jgi:alpha-L-fucosidase